VDGNSRALEDAVKLGYFEVIGVETYGGLSGEGKVESFELVKMKECLEFDRVCSTARLLLVCTRDTSIYPAVIYLKSPDKRMQSSRDRVQGPVFAQ
jgi:hypothetical protein